MSAVGYEQCSIVLYKRLLQLVLAVLINIFLVVCDDGLGDCLSDGIDLRGVTTAGDADTDVNACELVGADYEEGFVDLHPVLLVSEFVGEELPWLHADLKSQDFGLNERKWLTIDSNEAVAFLAVGNCRCSFLFAEALDALRGRHGGCDMSGEIFVCKRA